MLEGLVYPESFSLSYADMSVPERLKLMQQHQQQEVLSQSSNDSPELLQILQFHGSNNDELLQSTFSHSQMLETGFGPSHEAMDGCILRASSFQIDPADTMGVTLKNSEENRDISLNKRKSEVKTSEEENREKKNKVKAETESNINNKEASSDTSKETSKGASVIQKLDYIHVRARRGQATDRHSLAERARREKISKKMKYLQDLVPGCNKITGKAGVFDEIINYVQSLQRQVEFLSMKLAVLNPELEFAVEDLSINQFQAYFTNFPVVIASNPSVMVDLPLFPLNQQGSLDLSVINPNQTSMDAVKSENFSHYSKFLLLVWEVTCLLYLFASAICQLGNSFT